MLNLRKPRGRSGSSCHVLTDKCIYLFAAHGHIERIAVQIVTSHVFQDRVFFPTTWCLFTKVIRAEHPHTAAQRRRRRSSCWVKCCSVDPLMQAFFVGGWAPFCHFLLSLHSPHPRLVFIYPLLPPLPLFRRRYIVQPSASHRRQLKSYISRERKIV